MARTNPIYNLDLGAHKDFPLPREGTSLEFRSEFFNLFNKTNLGAPSANVLSGNFGTITGLASTRARFSSRSAWLSKLHHSSLRPVGNRAPAAIFIYTESHP